MEEKNIQFQKDMWEKTIKPTISTVLQKNKENTDKIVKSIEEKPNIEEVSVNNPEDIVNPLVEAQNATTEAVKAIPRVVIPELDISTLESKIDALISALEKKDLTVNIGETKLELKPVIKAIEELKKSIPKYEKQEITDYTMMLSEIMDIMEKPKDMSHHERMMNLMSSLAKTEDLVIIAEYLQKIIDKEVEENPPFEFTKEGRLKVEVDRSGGGGAMGLTKIETEALVSLSENQINGQQVTQEKAVISQLNSSYIPINSGQEFTGEWEEVSTVSTVSVNIKTDQLGICYFENSSDGINVDRMFTHPITDSVNHSVFFAISPRTKYMRLRFVNTSVTNQSFFRMQVTLSTVERGSVYVPIGESLNDNSTAKVVKSVISGKRDNGIFGNATLDNEDRLIVSAQPYTYGIAENSIAGHTSLLKFGTRTSIAAATSSTIWEGPTALYSYMTTAQQLKVSSSSANDTASGTGARTLTLYGLDTDFNEINETITLNGLTVVTTTKSFKRIYRVIVETCGTSFTNEGTITVTNNSGTVTQALVNANDGQTLMSIFTMPSSKVGYLIGMTVSNDSGKGARFSLLTRLNDGGILYPWQIKYRGYLVGGINNIKFEIPFKIPSKTDIEIRFTTPTAAGITSGGATFELWYENA